VVRLKRSCVNRTTAKLLLPCAGLLKFGVVQRLLLEKENDVKRQRSSTERVSTEFLDNFRCKQQSMIVRNPLDGVLFH